MGLQRNITRDLPFIDLTSKEEIGSRSEHRNQSAENEKTRAPKIFTGAHRQGNQNNSNSGNKSANDLFVLKQKEN